MIEAGAVEELRATLPAIAEEVRRSSGVEGISHALKPWYTTYPQPQRTQKQWVEFYLTYDVICGHLPTEALVGAMKTWAALPDSEFLPKPGKLREIAAQTPTPAGRLYARAHAVITAAEQITGHQAVIANMERDQVKAPDQIEAVHRMLQDFTTHNTPVAERERRRLKIGDKAAATDAAPKPYTGGIPAPGSHLTPEMLKALGRPLPKVTPAPAEFSEDL